MELMPCDCLRIICSFIKDRDYINFISTSKYFHSLIKYNLKIMTGQHKLSKISNVKDTYVFTNILYDFICFYPERIPHTITEITFCDKFNEESYVTNNELYKFKHIRKINVGMYYCKCNFMYGDILDTINKKEFAMTIITNRVFGDNFMRPRQYDEIIASCYLKKFKRMYTQVFCRYQSLQMTIEFDNGIYLLGFDLINSINRCINKMDENEYCYYKKDTLGISNDYDNYKEFLVFHINLILEYLVKLKNMVCEKHEKIRIEFLEDYKLARKLRIDFF